MYKKRKRVSRKKQKYVWLAVGLVCGISAAIWLSVSIRRVLSCEGDLDRLRSEMLTWDGMTSDAPAGTDAGFAVFLSVCDTNNRAAVRCGTGESIEDAWKQASFRLKWFVFWHQYDSVWLKADLVIDSRQISMKELARQVYAARHEFYRYGVAFDEGFDTALLEQEMNGAKIYDYDNGGILFNYLNSYLKKAGRNQVAVLPDKVRIFSCVGWFCDEDGQIYELNHEGLSYGRRQAVVDGDYAKQLILNASGFLEEQIQSDGSFIYGMYPRFDNELTDYNMVRHASSLWSLICRYRMAPDEALKQKIVSAISYMLEEVRYDKENRAYLYEPGTDEIKLGGLGVAVVALTEYMDVFQTDDYQEVACQLGEGILAMFHQDDGSWYHVLNGDFTPKEEFRTVYYDGEATFALCRLYALTGDDKWLSAAETSVARFIKEEYEQYKDHWVAYTMNELTKQVPDNMDYYEFAMRNVSVNLDKIRERDTTWHTYMELLMAAFETYDRMVSNGYQAEDFDLQAFLDTISVRAHRQLDGYFYPEYAMYMKNPARILDTFMVRHDGYRVRIDDVQHNIGGYYLYYKNYEKLLDYGLRVVDEG